MDFKLTRRQFQASAAAALAVSAKGVPAVAQEQTELVFNYYPPQRGPMFNNGILPWTKAIEEASQGTLKITIPSAALGPPDKALDVVEDGVADIGIISMVAREEQLSLYLLGDIPLLAETSKGAAIAAWETHEKFFAEKDQFVDTIPLVLWMLAPNALISNEHALLSAEDFDGFKIHMQGKNRIQIFQNLGAVPVPGPGRDQFEYVSSGVADGTAQPLGAAAILGMTNASKHVTQVPGGVGRVPFGLVINRDRFEGLPEIAQRAIIESSGLPMAAKFGSLWDGMDAAGLEKFKEAGVEIHAAPDALIEDIRAASAFQTDDWLAAADAAGVDGQAALEFYKETAAANK